MDNAKGYSVEDVDVFINGEKVDLDMIEETKGDDAMDAMLMRFKMDFQPTVSGNFCELYGGAWSRKMGEVPVVYGHSMWTNCKYIKMIEHLGGKVLKARIVRVNGEWEWRLSVIKAKDGE